MSSSVKASSKNLSGTYAIEPCAPAAANFAVIPVFDENLQIYDTLASIKRALQYSPQSVSVILVLNEPPSATVLQQQNNRELLHSLEKNDGKYDGGLELGRNLFYINLLDKEIKEKFRTVGNARKCGFDGAIRQSDGKVTDKIFFSLDADTVISANYFTRAFEYFVDNPQSAGAVFNFEHRLEEDKLLALAAMRYEIYLLDYAVKLHKSLSRYGFWTIGSAFACTVRDYLRCGGMRRHAAGEDFYFLQALRKVGDIGILKDAFVYPAGRVSDRVPFGTGPAIARQLKGEYPGLYDQQAFDLLKEFFLTCRDCTIEELAGDIYKLAPSLLQEFFEQQDFANVWQKIVKNTPKEHAKLLESLHTYCDGFFILKFCHYLEETYPADFKRQPLPTDEMLAEKLTELRSEVSNSF